MVFCRKCGSEFSGKFCTNCGSAAAQSSIDTASDVSGAKGSQKTSMQNDPSMDFEPQNQNQKEGAFKTWKLVSGIISIVFSLLVLFQSCAVGTVNIIDENGEVGGSGGAIVAVMLLAGGIISVVTRKSINRGGNIALSVLYGIGTLTGFLLAGSYVDLKYWASWCLICVALAIVADRKNRSI